MNMPLTLSQFTRALQAKNAKAEELSAAYDRIAELEDGLRGVIGLIHMLNNNSDIPHQVRWHMFKNHRVIDAEELLSPTVNAHAVEQEIA